jgi:signal transduction histidine kinase
VKTATNIPQPESSPETYNQGRVPTDLMKGISHELHTPLHVIIGLCQLLERDDQSSLSPTQRDAIGRMERNAQSLLETVNHLLSCLRQGRFD